MHQAMQNSDLKDSWRRRNTVLTEIRRHTPVASTEKIVLFDVAGAVLISAFSTVGMDIRFARITYNKTFECFNVF